MSRPRKIDTFVRELENLIREEAPGFTSELPGQREMAQRFRISQSAVHIGMVELERRGLIRIEPYRGAIVVYRPKSPVVTRNAEERINLAVCEELTYQREFWMDSVRRFRELHDGVEVKVRFFPPDTRVENTSDNDENCIVVRPEHYRNIQRPLVPLSALLPEKLLAETRRNFLPGIPEPDWNVALPYQLQVPSVICNASAGPVPQENNIMRWLDWAGTLGKESLSVPDLNFLRDSCGLNRISVFYEKNGRISPEFRLFFEVLEKMAAMRLINLVCRMPEDWLPQLRQGLVKCIWAFSYNWGKKDPGTGMRLEVAPVPLAGNSCINFFLANVVMVGAKRVSEVEQAFFRYLVSDEFQQKMLHGGAGLSPYRDKLAQYRPEPGGTDLSRMVQWVGNVRFDESFNRNFNRLWFELLKKLRSPVIVPLLLGRISANEAEEYVVAHKLLDKHQMESALADKLYLFDEDDRFSHCFPVR